MKKAYKTPVAEMLVFDYTKVVADSNSGGLNLLGTTHEQWCHGPSTKTDTVDDVANTCGGSD